MLAVDLVIMQRMTTELESCEKRLKFDSARLEDTIRQLNRLQQKGMDQVRYTLRRRLTDLQEQTRMVRSMHQVLGRITDSYRDSERRVQSRFDGPLFPKTVWQVFPIAPLHILVR